MRTYVRRILLLPLALLLPHCGKLSVSPEGTESISNGMHRTKLSVKVTAPHLGLLTADMLSYTISMQGCVSGLSSEASDTNPFLDAYILDHGCLGQLTSIQYRGTTWTMSSTNPFSTYAVGDSGIYTANNDGITQLQVTVLSQLSDPLAATDIVAYSFVEKQPGNSETVADFRINAPTVVLGTGAPSFVIQQANLVGIATTGEGQFAFTLECDQMVSFDADNNPNCHDNLLGQTTYLLTQDPMDHQLSFAEVGALFAAGTGVTSVTIPDDFIEPNDLWYPNGGFTTKQGSNALTGPGILEKNPNMILIVASQGAYQLFKITVNLY